MNNRVERLSDSQMKLLKKGVEKLREGRMVFYNGGANGKTELVEVIRLRSAQLPFKSRLKKNNDIMVLDDIRQFPRSDRSTTTAMQRYILKSLNGNDRGDMVDVERNYGAMMVELLSSRIQPTLVFDNIERLRENDYITIKTLNEYIHKGQRCGMAFVLAGDLINSKMKMPFYYKTAEIEVEKIQHLTDIKHILEHWFEDSEKYWIPSVLEQFKRCNSMQGMLRAAESYVEWMFTAREDDESVATEAAREYVTKSKNIERLYAKAA